MKQEIIRHKFKTIPAAVAALPDLPLGAEVVVAGCRFVVIESTVAGHKALNSVDLLPSEQKAAARA